MKMEGFTLRRKVGEMQDEYLQIMENVLQAFREMKELLSNGDLEALKEYLKVAYEFSKLMQTILSVFGYEQYSSISESMMQLCKREEIEPLNSELPILGQRLDNMISLIEVILGERKGKKRICGCCGEKIYYRPLSDYYAQQREKYGVKPDVPETLNAVEYECPFCGASDRDRLLIAFLKLLEIDKAAEGEKLLQFAPAKAIEHWINANCSSLIYHSTDLFVPDVTFCSDIQDMNMVEDSSYDFFICSHVLEHVQDDRKAMKELYRILKQDGFGLFLVPISLDRETIDEEWGLPSSDCWRRFGQGDHCRVYSKEGVVERLQNTGFYVHQLGKDFFGVDVFLKNGLTDTSILYVLTKEEGDINTLIESRKQKRRVQKSMCRQPLVSVVLPTYNHEEYVEAAIESVLKQTYTNFEFLVADDASTDGTVNKILNYEDRIDQIHLFNENTRGQVVNFLVECAKGKYIAMMHSDDLWEHNKLQMQVDYLEAHPACAACFTGCMLFNDQGELCGNGPFLMANKTKEGWCRYFWKYGNCLAHPSVVIRKEIYIELLNEYGVAMFRQLPDFWMWLHLIQKSEIHIIETELTLFRIHADGTNRNTSARISENMARHMTEEAFIWYDIIKKMDFEYFVRSFKDMMIKKDIVEEKELLCEKLFVLMRIPRKYCIQAAIFYLFEIYQIEGVAQLLSEQYQFTSKDIHALSYACHLYMVNSVIS